MPSAAIEIRDLVVDYQKRRVLNGLSLEVKRGEIYGFLGPNGAGKTTTIKTILGFIPRFTGTVLLDGLPPSKTRSRAKVGYLPEECTYYRFLTAPENLSFYGELCGLRGADLKKRVDAAMELVGLAPHRKKPVSALSKGTVQKLGLAQALLHSPEILILDEPTSGLDPVARMEFRRTLAGLKEKGCTIFFSSHELSEVELVCDSLAIVKSGEVIKSGTLASVLGPEGPRSLERFFLETIEKPS